MKSIFQDFSLAGSKYLFDRYHCHFEYFDWDFNRLSPQHADRQVWLIASPGRNTGCGSSAWRRHWWVLWSPAPSSPRACQSTRRRCSLVLSSVRKQADFTISFWHYTQLSRFSALVVALKALYIFPWPCFSSSIRHITIGFLEILLGCLIHSANCKFDQFQRSEEWSWIKKKQFQLLQMRGLRW